LGVQNPAQSSNATSIWSGIKTKVAQDAERLNREIMSYNLKLPSGIPHRPLLNVRYEIERLSQDA
jgi:hypothetical protein